MTRIDFTTRIFPLLFKVEKPGRYSGGEYGSIVKEGSVLRTVVSFPDLYEIGMSNISTRRLYSLINAIPGASCERVFAPAKDMEAELKNAGIPLYSLETCTTLDSFDIIGFSLGYELLFTNVLAILELGNIPLGKEERNDSHPIVIAGGTSVTNPHPYERFIDCAYIGEAENFISGVFPELVRIKQAGGGRKELLSAILSDPSVWSHGSGRKARKNVWMGFSDTEAPPLLPVPNIKPVHDQGSVEIMRGCPNGCRFCHSGIFYRPFRMKKPSVILKEVEALVFGCGYKKISLLSLSTGDYREIDKLLTLLTDTYKDLGVSFSLPSLRIESMSPAMLGDLAEVRKSGLTFAVETPVAHWQAGINKKAESDKIVEILLAAREQGFRGAKFYFMVGLPVYEEDESDRIIDYLFDIKDRTGMKININVATFVPKSHTPFERAGQLDEETSLARIMYIKRVLEKRSIKTNYHSPFASFLEGMISRGDRRAGEVILSAYAKGARLDAWEEHLSRDIWRSAVSEAGWDVKGEITRKRDSNETLPWNDVDLGVDAEYLEAEREKSANAEYTESCIACCPVPCGACTDTAMSVRDYDEEMTALSGTVRRYEVDKNKKAKLLVSFAKKDRTVFLSHLNVVSIFEESLLRAGYYTVSTQGFNPHPVMEFASPIPLGMEALEDIVSIEVHNFDDEESMIGRMNRALPGGFSITRVVRLADFVKGEKKISLASVFWGSDFFIQDIAMNETAHIHLFTLINDAVIGENGSASLASQVYAHFLVNNGICVRYKKIDKKDGTIQAFIKSLAGSAPNELGFRITRLRCLARNTDGEPDSYFNVCK